MAKKTIQTVLKEKIEEYSKGIRIPMQVYSRGRKSPKIPHYYTAEAKTKKDLIKEKENAFEQYLKRFYSYPSKYYYKGSEVSRNEYIKLKQELKKKYKPGTKKYDEILKRDFYVEYKPKVKDLSKLDRIKSNLSWEPIKAKDEIKLKEFENLDKIKANYETVKDIRSKGLFVREKIVRRPVEYIWYDKDLKEHRYTFSGKRVLHTFKIRGEEVTVEMTKESARRFLRENIFGGE